MNPSRSPPWLNVLNRSWLLVSENDNTEFKIICSPVVAYDVQPQKSLRSKIVDNRILTEIDKIGRMN